MMTKLYNKKGGNVNSSELSSTNKTNGLQNIFKEDFKSNTSIAYFAIITIIMLMVLFFSFKEMNKMKADRRTKTIFIVILISVYILFIGFPNLKWNLESIFVIILALSVLLGIISFLIIYYGNDVCTYIEDSSESTIKNIEVKILLLIGIFVVIYLGIYNKNDYYMWSIYDTIRFIIILIILRIIYFYVKKYNLSYYKTITDILTVIILYFNGKRMYRILNLKIPPISVPKNLKSVDY